MSNGQGPAYGGHQQQGWQQPQAHGQQGWQQQAYPEPWRQPGGAHQPGGHQQPGAMVAYGRPPMRPPMEMGQAFNAFWKNYAVFEGRAGKGEYWWMMLINLLIAVPLSFIGIGVLYSLAAFIPGIALTVRRLHDVNKSGWWLLICLIPLAGLFLLILCAGDSDPAGAQYDAPNGSQPAV